jgi:hypothetical protein
MQDEDLSPVPLSHCTLMCNTEATISAGEESEEIGL